MVIVGAGVVGLSTAVHLCERFGSHVQVTVVADQFSPHTTGDKAGMLMFPVDFNDADAIGSGDGVQSEEQRKVLSWASTTFRKYAHHLSLCTASLANPFFYTITLQFMQVSLHLPL